MSGRPVRLLERNKVLLLKAGLGFERVEDIAIVCVAGDDAELVWREFRLIFREEVVAAKLRESVFTLGPPNIHVLLLLKQS